MKLPTACNSAAGQSAPVTKLDILEKDALFQKWHAHAPLDETFDPAYGISRLHLESEVAARERQHVDAKGLQL